MSFNKFSRVTDGATFTVAVGGDDQSIGSVVLVDGGSNYLVGDVLITINGSTTGTAELVITVTGITQPTSYSPTTMGVGGAISTFSFVDTGDWFAADDGDYTAVSQSLSGVSGDFVDHTEYESGGNVNEYIEGSGLLLKITSVDGDGAVDGLDLGTNEVSRNYVAGTQVRVIQSNNDSALINIDTVDAVGTVLTISIIDGGVGYTTDDDLVASQMELKTDSPEVYWQGTMTGVFNPATAPSTSVGDNNPRIKVSRPADAPQLAIQKRYIDGGATTVFAEPTLVNSEGDVVGNTLRAENCVDRSRCEANGFIWVIGATGDVDAGDYGFCREMTVAEAVVFWDTKATYYNDCPAGTIYDGADSCDALDSTYATGAELINDAVDAEQIGLEKAMRDCEVSGNFWDISTNTCIAGDTAGNFDMDTFVFGTIPAGQTGSSNGTKRDYLANACRNLDYIWKYDTNTCIAAPSDVTLDGFVTQATCLAAGYTWIAGTCYNPNDFGDGHNRNATTQEDPNVAPK